MKIRIAAVEPQNKIITIKHVRTLSGMGLKESKETVEGTFNDGVFSCDNSNANSYTLAQLRSCATIEVINESIDNVREYLHNALAEAVNAKQYDLASEILEILIKRG